MPGCVRHIPVRDHQLSPTEPAEVPDYFYQAGLQSHPEIVVHCGVHAEPEDHPLSIVSEYLHLYGGGVTETLLVPDVILEVARASEVGHLHVNPLLAGLPLEAQWTVTVEARLSVDLHLTFGFVLAGIILTQSVHLNNKQSGINQS